jgi:hypothetical protein
MQANVLFECSLSRKWEESQRIFKESLWKSPWAKAITYIKPYTSIIKMIMYSSTILETVVPAICLIAYDLLKTGLKMKFV